MTKQKAAKSENPHPVDIHVGSRVKLRRMALGVSQDTLGKSMGLTFQQIQKYERGTNRISAGRLFQFSKILEVPINYFYDNIDGAEQPVAESFGFADNEQAPFGEEEDLMQKKETFELVRTYYSVRSEEKRKSILKFINSMADDDSE